MLPSFELLNVVTQRFKDEKITFVLGGSALLYSLGLLSDVKDWDLCVEVPLEQIEACLGGLNYSLLPNNEIFKSDFLIRVQDNAAEIDIIGHFKIRRPDDGSIHRVPLKISHHWNGFPMADPHEWMVAYELMGREDKTLLLKKYCG